MDEVEGTINGKEAYGIQASKKVHSIRTSTKINIAANNSKYNRHGVCINTSG
jgi:hypothetical protein